MIPSFSIARLPRIEFGAGTLRKLPDIAAGYGKRLLLVTGERSFTASPSGEWLLAELKGRGFGWETLRVSGEPSPQFVDEAVRALRGNDFDAVVGIGGGSPLDTAKAVAGLLKPGNSVLDHLEDVRRGLAARDGGDRVRRGEHRRTRQDGVQPAARHCLRRAIHGTLGSGAVTLWLAGNSVFTAFCVVSLAGVIIGAATGAPTGLMLKSVLMAAS